MNCVAPLRRCGITFHHYINQLQLTKSVRHLSFESNSSREKGANGHYDVVVVGGGPAGLSMACAIGTYYYLRSYFSVYDV